MQQRIQAAQATAKSVIASAKRLMLVRHGWRMSNSIALMNVPAWPMPIHQTKFVIAKPQPTGMLMPQTPTPRISSHAIETVSSMTSASVTPTAASQSGPTGRRRTTSAT